MNSAGCPFVICTIGRSRTAWLSALLTYQDWRCFYESAVYMRSIADVVRFFGQGNVGTAESAVAPGWDVLRCYVPDLVTAVVRRPVAEVVESFMALRHNGLPLYDEPLLRRIMQHGARALERVARQPGVLTLDYADLATEDACRALWDRCMPHPWPQAWWLSWKDRNVQADVLDQVRYYQANKAAVDGFKRTVHLEMMRLARAGLIGRRRLQHAA